MATSLQSVFDYNERHTTNGEGFEWWPPALHNPNLTLPHPTSIVLLLILAIAF